MAQPLISVIIPVYNVEAYLNKCVESVRSQTYQNLQIILVDDGSKDASGTLCDAFAQADARIKVIHKPNGGLSSARNAGLDIAKGEYVGFVDSDDYIALDMYETMLNELLAADAQMAMCGRTNVFEDETPSQRLFCFDSVRTFEAKEAIRRLLTWDGCDSSACDKLCRMELFEGIRYPLGVLHEDLPITTQLMRRCSRIVHIGGAKYFYLQRSGSICKSEFSERKLDAYVQAHQNELNVKQFAPDLAKEAEYFTAMSTATIVWTAAISRRITLAQCGKVLRLVLKQWRVFLTNPYILGKEKYALVKRIVHMFLNVL